MYPTFDKFKGIVCISCIKKHQFGAVYSMKLFTYYRKNAYFIKRKRNLEGNSDYG